ncbi:MAG TPA: SDR family NAD(P)-dependent oxidoreductase [Thermoanaerobaculia bacterium]
MTESYLKSLMCEVAGSLSPDFDSLTAFGEMGIDSFHVLKIVKRLEMDFGALPKSLLFENFRISDLAGYFVGAHEPTLLTMFASQLNGEAPGNGNGHGAVARAIEPAKGGAGNVVPAGDGPAAKTPIRILERDAWLHPELGPLVRPLFERYKFEGSASRGTRTIAPNLFIGSGRHGYFNYGRSGKIVLVYCYTGPQEHLAALREEMYRYCEENGYQLNFLNDGDIEPICGRSFSATPFGAMQRIEKLAEFRLDGGAMRRLRYQVSKFQKAGPCKTIEYRCGTSPETDQDVVRIIDRWCEGKTMVNPLVREIRSEVLAGTLPSEHRLFLTYLDDVLQNVILITAMSSEINGYLMDLEFYPADMPLGGLEFAIVEMVSVLAAEGCDVLSLGGTYGCKLVDSPTADPELDKFLDDLRERKIFNDESNLQFKNKFRPLTVPIFLCRPVGSGDPENVIDIIMMIADPDRMLTPDADTPAAVTSSPEAAAIVPAAPPAAVAAEPVPDRPVPPVAPQGHRELHLVDGNERERALAEGGFNPLNVPLQHVDFDLKTDSWAQLTMPAIDAQMGHLHGQLQQPVSVDDSLRSVFPMTHFVLTESGQAAEHLFFKAWPKKGPVPQNLLFPSTIAHQIDKGFTPVELPHPAVFRLDSEEPQKAEIDLDALRAFVAREPGAIACAIIEVGNNAAGGQAVSTQHLRDVKAVLDPHAIPLVIDATRVLENARFLIEQDREHEGKSLWTVVREILSCADAVIGSLTKDFCVNKGGIIATNDVRLYQRLQDLLHEDGGGLDMIERKLIALSLQNRKHIEAKVARRIEDVRLISAALRAHGVPTVQPAGGHCVLVDVKQLPELSCLPEPVASFLAWLHLNTGIRAAAHSVGMQKQTSLNDLVRLAIPVGLKREDVGSIVERLIAAFTAKAKIPELVPEGTRSPGSVARYSVARYHNAPEQGAAGSGVAAKAPGANAPAASPAPAMAASPSREPAAASSREISSAPAANAPAETHSDGVAAKPAPRGAQEVAIVGMAGRYPKAKNIGELWANLAQGRDCIDELPAERRERRLQHGSTAKYRGGFIDEVDRFDSLFFNIAPREAEMLDPQERLFLEVAWEAIEDAGYYPEILAQDEAPRNIGVFVGAVWAMYQIVGVDEQRAGNHVAPNSFLWSIANRVSYWMNLSGPSLTVDTACSSSLTALYLACEAIQSGECPAAIVGGVNLDLHQAKLDINLIGGALSPDGVCRTFGKGANGYVAGEGVGALFLKPLAQAEKDGDHVYGVIRSVVVNHGGRTSGYFVPNPSAQSNVISAALQKANVEPSTIGYIEAHGTGTELGDPIEISGLSRAFGTNGVGAQTCAIGSIKSNIGHLEAAAGVVSVSKVLLQMQHRQLAPSLHSSELNEHIDFERSPFYVVQKLEDWKAKEAGSVRLPLRAGISSFGAGGANAHVILESYEPRQAVPEEPAPVSDLIFPLSARSEEQLRESAVRLVEHLRRNRVALKDTAFTLQHGRKSFEHRVAVVAGTQEELVERLAAFIDGKKTAGVAAGNVKLGETVTRLLSRSEKQEFVRLLSQGRDPQKIAALWAEGMLADWQGFPSRGRRVSLPTYPFAGKRHWVPAPAAAVRPALQPAAAMHPMVDANESTFERQLFRKVFTERDFFIYDHCVSDIPTLPGVAYLEFARKAGELAAGRPVRRIQNILWLSPIAVQDSVPKEVFIELKPNGEAVQFEVFSETDGRKTPHSQGRLLYTNRQDGEPESIDLDAVRARCASSVDGQSAYPLFHSFGLGLGPSFQVLQRVYTSSTEALGVLKLPEFREGDLESLILHPSLIDGSLQSGMTWRLSDSVGEMMVPYSIGEVEILHPLQANCLSYTTEAKDDKKSSRVLKSNVLILDETGKVLVRIRESTGVPLLDVHQKDVVDAEGFRRLYYADDWEKAPLSQDDARRHTPQSILLFDTDDTLRQLYRARAASSRVLLVRPGAGFRQLDDQSWEIDPASRDDFARLFEAVAEANVDDICFAWPPAGAESGLTSFLYLCQALTQAKLEGKVQLLYVDRDGLPQTEAIGGFVNTLRGEYPKLLCKNVQVREGSVLDAIWTEQCARTQDANIVRHDADGRHVRRMKVVELEDGGDFAGLRENGVYVITGGAGGLGLIFAEMLAKQYKARLVLTGRSSLSAEREAKLDELRTAGAEVLYLAGDISRRDDVEQVIAETRSRFGEIHGVIHAAGVVRDSYIRNKTAEELHAVLAPKVEGTLHLDELTRDERLDFFVTFSSLAAVTGNPGQSDYSFANSFMDSFVAGRERLRAAGERSGRSLSINWSLWADGGMRPDEQTELALKKTLGMKPLSVETGLDAFVRGLASSRSRFVVLEGIREKLDLAWGEKKKSATAAAPASASASSAAVDDGGLVAWLQDELSLIVMEFLKLEKSEVATDKVLLDLGFDSIGLATFANAMNDRFQLDVTPILFFDYPSIADISKHLSEERRDDLVRFYRGTDATAPVPAAQQPERAEAVTFEIRKGWSPAPSETLDRPAASAGGLDPALRFVNQPIAIVGMSGVMPQSEDLEEFWENLRSSKDLVTVIPRDRWRWEDYFGDPLKEPNKSSSKWGGFMKEVDKFDPLFFGISPREAQMMDPQQRLFLEHVWKAVEDSGQKVSDLAGSRTGVFVGVATNDYLSVLTGEGGVIDGYSASGNSHAVLANRVSFLLGLRGPSAPLDTACSSSLVAMHRAIESIHTGSCDMAIVGGVHVMLSPAAFISFSSAGMLSPDGKCKTFDKSANGYVRGEGCGAVFLKTLAAAEADGNHIYAVVKATAENHGGKVTALTAPNSAAQAELLVEAYEKGQVDPATVGYVEAHGTGTSLGDPIEIQALSKAFSELYKKRGKAPASTPHCGLSSVKTNIGHLETAAGIAGIFKAVLSIKNREIPANIHLEEVNPYIKLEGTPFFIADKLTPWMAPVGADGAPAPRVAGVSSFGFGGANAHVVLQEYIAPGGTTAAATGPQLVVLSAKNDQRLDDYIKSIGMYLEETQVELIDLAYTLQVGRDEMPSRVALVVSSIDELRQKLAQILAGEMPQGCHRGRAAKDAAKAPDGLTDPFRLAELWVSGAKTDWRALYGSAVPRRVSAPTYPFARDRHWFEGGGEAIPGDSRPAVASTAVLHPLVHRNSSTFEEQKFSTRFSGEEFFLADHVVETQKILPGVAYLEMARAAGALSANADVRIIRNLIWEKPLIVGSDAREVEVALSPARGDIRFAIRSAAGETGVTHCTGRLGYEVEQPAPEWLDIAGIRERCREQVMTREELYPFLRSVGLKLGSGFQIVQSIFANESESLAILELPEHLRKSADLFWLHPALMDGSLHTAIGLLKARGIDAPLGLPYSVDEVQILHSLRDLHYGYATWSFDAEADVDRQRVTFHLLDKDGRVLVRLKDFTTRPLPGAPKASLPRAVAPPEELKTLLPIWNPVRVDAGSSALPVGDVLLLGGDRAQREWVRSSCPAAQLLDLAPDAGIDRIAEALGARSFEELLWIAPDVTSPGADERIVDQQEEGVLAVFRIIKALLQLGYGNRKLRWTIVTGRTQRVTELEQIQPAHAGVVGLVGSLAKEYPHWDLKLLDLDSPQSVTARECLSLPWDEQGNALARRHGEWFRQELALVTTPPETSPVYRKDGVYVVVGGAGGVGEVWSRFMIENYQARVVWIGRQEYNAAIEAKVNALSELGPAPLYISADATDVAALERARASVLEIHSAIHGVVHSAIVLRDQSLSRMEESTFRASLAAKVDVSVNLDRVFGNDELDFMLFFSSIISMVKSSGQSNYAAGCTFKDSFAHRLQQRRPYPAKIMNWGYWGDVGVVADESYKKIMRQVGIGSIEPHEGMSSLQVLVGSGLHQLAIMKTIGGQSIMGLEPTEAIAFYPQTPPAALPQVHPALAG